MDLMTRSLVSIIFTSLLLIVPLNHAAEPAVARNSVQIEALSRLKGMDLEANPAVKAAVMRVVETTRGTADFVELVRDFGIKDQEAALLDYALAHPKESAGVEAMRLVLGHENTSLLRQVLSGTNALSAVTALAGVNQKESIPLLEPLLTDRARELALRKAALQAMTQSQDGATAVLRLAKEDKLPADLKLTATTELNNVRWENIKTEAAAMLPPPQTQGEPLPPVSELVKRTGDVSRGAEIFFKPIAACSSCHQVNGKGTDFGPNLSEIGSKFGKDAMYDAILDPSAGISFGFEAWQIDLKNGDEAFGLIVSETAEEVAVKTQTGIITRYKKSDIVRREQRKISIMPAGLQASMSVGEFVDLIEYLASLKKAAQ